MIVANFCHIKATNGLFHYGVDYLRRCEDLVARVLVRPALADAARAALPGLEIVCCSMRRLLGEAAAARRRGDLVFTPTSHPLPWLSNQWVVVHDAYPFTTGPRATLKTRLLRWSLASSRCTVGYINQSDGLPFVQCLGVGADRRVFAPNEFPARVPDAPPASQPAQRPLTVGLVGTDSAKKNYDALFDALRRAGGAGRLHFRAYGHRTPYFEALLARHPDIQLSLDSSDAMRLQDFFSHIDVLASVAEQEGFGRPIAAALQSNIPCLLLDRPVFLEFFDPGARFFRTEADLVRALLDPAEAVCRPPPPYAPPPRALQAHAAAIERLRQLGAATARHRRSVARP